MMKKPINYSTEQLTTAKRSFIHDLVFESHPDGSFTEDCDLAKSGVPFAGPSASTVMYDKTGEKLHVLNMYGRQWLLWGRACAVLGQQRQFLNYRIINNHDHVEVLRMDSASALQLSMLVGKSCFASSKTPRARCKTIFFDYAALPNLRRTATRNKLRRQNGGSASDVTASPASSSRVKRAADDASSDYNSDSHATNASSSRRAVPQRSPQQKRARQYTEDSDSGSDLDSDSLDMSSDDEATAMQWARSDSQRFKVERLDSVRQAASVVTEEMSARSTPLDIPYRSAAHNIATGMELLLSASQYNARRTTRTRSESTESGSSHSSRHEPLWISVLATAAAAQQAAAEAVLLSSSTDSGHSRRKPLVVHRALPQDMPSRDLMPMQCVL